MGRPSLLTPERTARIAELVAAGNRLETAAQAGGVSISTFHSWMARGRAERERLSHKPKARPKASEAPYVDFLDTIEKAYAEGEAALVLQIRRAAQEPKTWQAAAWMLERSRPDKWGRPWRPKEDQAQEVAGAILRAIQDMSNGSPLPGE